MTAPNPQASNVTDPVTVKRAFESLGLQYNQSTAPHNAAPHGHPQMNSMPSEGEYEVLAHVLIFQDMLMYKCSSRTRKWVVLDILMYASQ